ncbi:TetR/AcrR family transcriptional regulator [Streptomyces sp. PA03-5A]|nr:TetR/AcrR family transcriptional regulator [Streptomyces sp. PA03-5A]
MVESDGSRRMQERAPRTRPPQIELTDAEILWQGLEAFAELGYSGASVRELAKRLAVSHNFIHDRFGSKDNFWRAVMDNALAEPFERLEAILERDMDDAEKFQAFVREFYVIAANRPHLNRIISDESVFDSDRLDYLYSAYTSRFLAGVEPLANRLMAAGRMPKITMDVFLSALTGPAVILSQQQLQRHIRKSEDPSTVEWERLTNSLADTVIRGLLR